MNDLPIPTPQASENRSGEPADEFLRALYDTYGHVLMRFADRLLGGDWHRAEDVFQEAAIRAWQHAAELDPDTGALRPWLFTVVRNLVIDGYRARRTRPPEADDEGLGRLPVTDGVDRALTTHVVFDAMRDLAPFQREVLLHMYYVGRSVSQTAKVLGVPPGTVKSRTHYAMRALREGLSSRGLRGPVSADRFG
ncbi:MULTISPECIES: sigma-70 family RNA polymerase sigma factor [unclassified Streptomyces]|uniref:Sigma-70 family RNA polymerase sigma factor n=1 Tax=Streptomyces sp. R33 TaxID=3238629 RepID=A0AB39Y1J3_9ACTN|nr:MULTISPECIES: sigma-70 family RNA polymerase sigma factor [unclassified Streptomyces]KJY47287.1 RNA polymerase [Streptomyces sp. NRRL S-444]TDU74237.1 RNA polymerase sigma-70 factor (ECF subfamily) [Streptomyces sp. KS 21]THA40254.1 sigma-70 family RNA polymerase sigma factor [Streptomyces sp. A1547]